MISHGFHFEFWLKFVGVFAVPDLDLSLIIDLAVKMTAVSICTAGVKPRWRFDGSGVFFWRGVEAALCLLMDRMGEVGDSYAGVVFAGEDSNDADDVRS